MWRVQLRLSEAKQTQELQQALDAEIDAVTQTLERVRARHAAHHASTDTPYACTQDEDLFRSQLPELHFVRDAAIAGAIHKVWAHGFICDGGVGTWVYLRWWCAERMSRAISEHGCRGAGQFASEKER